MTYIKMGLTGLLGVLLTSTSARALLINFNDYAAGSLAGQPASGTKWSGGGSYFQVTSGAGVDSSNAVVTQPLTTGAQASAFTPSTTDLPGFNGSSSSVEISFQFRYLSAPGSDSSTFASLQFGYTSSTAMAARFWLRNDGRLGYSDGGTTPSVLLTNPTNWNTVTAIVDYATQTYTFSLNGVPYVNQSNDSVFDFRGPTTASTFRILDHGSETAWIGAAFDNIGMTVVPEPTTAALIVLTAGLYLVRKRKSLQKLA